MPISCLHNYYANIFTTVSIIHRIYRTTKKQQIYQTKHSVPRENELHYRTLWHCSKDNLTLILFNNHQVYMDTQNIQVYTANHHKCCTPESNQKNSPSVRFLHLPSDPHCTRETVLLKFSLHLTSQVSLYLVPVQLYNSTNGTWEKIEKLHLHVPADSNWHGGTIQFDTHH